jgi:hypothetical protein
MAVELSMVTFLDSEYLGGVHPEPSVGTSLAAGVFSGIDLTLPLLLGPVQRFSQIHCNFLLGHGNK